MTIITKYSIRPHQTWTRAAWAGRCCLRALSGLLHNSVALLLVAVFALLCPLSCIIHCELARAAQRRAEPSLFLCGHTNQAGEATPQRAPTPAPRALFEILPTVLTGVLAALLALLRLRPVPLFSLPQLAYRPPTPPPRLHFV